MPSPRETLKKGVYRVACYLRGMQTIESPTTPQPIESPWLSYPQIAQLLPFKATAKRIRRVLRDRGIEVHFFGKTPMVWRQDFYRAFGASI